MRFWIRIHEVLEDSSTFFYTLADISENKLKGFSWKFYHRCIFVQRSPVTFWKASWSDSGSPDSASGTLADVSALSQYSCLLISYDYLLSLAIPSWVGAISTSQRAVTPCGWVLWRMWDLAQPRCQQYRLPWQPTLTSWFRSSIHLEFSGTVTSHLSVRCCINSQICDLSLP